MDKQHWVHKTRPPFLIASGLFGFFGVLFCFITSMLVGLLVPIAGTVLFALGFVWIGINICLIVAGIVLWLMQINHK